MNMNSQVGISEDQLANRRKDNMMKVTISRAAKRADQIVAARAAQLRNTGFTRHSALLHWRAEFHRNAV